jgi:hypothetical protein
MIINGRGVPPLRAPGVPDDAAPSLGEGHEQALAGHEGPFLHFCSALTPFAREEFRSRLARELATYLEQGFIEGDDSEGPVQRQQASADQAEGVVPGVVNLVLRDEVMVFGFLDNQGVGDCYFARAPTALGQAFFCICIESGMASGGPYEIFVSPAMDWEEFLRQLPPA